MDKLKKQIELIRVKIFSIQHSDFAFWVKEKVGSDFVMIYFNQKYKEDYLTSNDRLDYEYLGKTDFEFWGFDIGNLYNGNDWEVYNEKKSISFIEDVLIGGKKYKRRFQKKYFKDDKNGNEYIIGNSVDIDEELFT